VGVAHCWQVFAVCGRVIVGVANFFFFGRFVGVSLGGLWALVSDESSIYFYLTSIEYFYSTSSEYYIPIYSTSKG